VASHIVSDERLGEPETNRELFDHLAQHGWLPAELAATMGRMAGFRNIVVHGYGGVNLEIRRISSSAVSPISSRSSEPSRVVCGRGGTPVLDRAARSDDPWGTRSGGRIHEGVNDRT